MDSNDRERLESFDVLIEAQESLKDLTTQKGWDIFIGILKEMRVDAMDMAVAEGDTTGKKAEARVLGALLNTFYSWGDETYLNDIKARKEALKKEIDEVDRARREQSVLLGSGLGATI
jgi:hypothetical protein